VIELNLSLKDPIKRTAKENYLWIFWGGYGIHSS